MKKFSILIILLLVLSLSSCKKEEPEIIDNTDSPVQDDQIIDDNEPDEEMSDFQTAINNMMLIESLRIDVTLNNVPFVGSISSHMLFSESATYFSTLNDEFYTVVIDGRMYDLIEYEDGLIAAENLNYKAALGSDVYMMFVASDFELQESGYYTTEEIYNDMSNLEVKIEEGYITELKADVDTGFYTAEVVFLISGLNETTVTVPEYQILGDLETALIVLDELDIVVSEENETHLVIDDGRIVYEFESDHYIINEYLGVLHFYPEDLTIGYESLDWQASSPFVSIEKHSEDHEYADYGESAYYALTLLYRALNNE